MIGKRIAGGFARLGHKIGDVDARRFGSGDGVGDLGNEQVGENAGVEGTRAEKNQIGLANGFDGFGKRAHGTREEREFLNRDSAGGDARLAAYSAAVLQGSDQGHVGNRGRKDATADGQDFAADANGFGEIAGNVCEGGEKEVAKIVADEAATGVETILEEATE